LKLIFKKRDVNTIHLAQNRNWQRHS